MNEDRVKRKLAAIFIADVVGYSRLMRDDEVATFNTLSAYRKVMTNLIRQHRGRVVDTSGDNVLAEFSSVVDAMQSAVSIQRELKAKNANLEENRRMELRIGINIGDVIEEGDCIYGDGVNIAARLEKLARPGGICISRMAYDQIESKLPLGYEYIGEQVVKNISKPLHVYRVFIDPEDQSSRERGNTGRESERKQSHSAHGFRGEHFGKHFQQVKGHLKGFAKDMKEDDQISQTFEDVKGRFQTFAGDMRGSRERKKEALQSLTHSKQLRNLLGIAGFLFLINAFSSFGEWWFQYPVLAIGLGSYLHWLKTVFFSPEKVRAMQDRMFQKEVSRLDPGSRDSEEGMKLAEARAGARVQFYNHLFIYAGVNTFLILINLFTSPFDWWFQFPLLGWGIGLFFHWMKLK